MSLRKLNFLMAGIYAGETKNMGRGVFTKKSIEAGKLIETAPVIVMTAEDRKLIDKTLLHDYIFEWGDDGTLCCMALGLVPLYNHSYKSNCEYEMNFSEQIICIKTVQPIKAGEELFINYNGDWNNPKKLWFHTK